MSLKCRRMYYLCFLTLVFVASPLSSNGQPVGSPRTVISLDGPGWKLVGLQLGEGEKLAIHLGGSGKAEFIPTSVPNDVQRAISLKDPLGQGPEVWDINKREWWYVRTFLSPKVLPSQQARLVFDGVDYFADVWLNGEKLGSHEGAYTRFAYDVTKRFRVKEQNCLAVRVTSPWKIQGRSHYEFMKGAFMETYEAQPGPAYVVFPLGVHRSVRLEITSTTRLEDLQVVTTALRDQTADLKLRLSVSNSGSLREGTLRLAIRPENFSGPALDLAPRSITFAGQVGESQSIELTAQIEHPRLWWTWDQGAQNLYTAEATLLDEKKLVTDRLSKNFGIRTLERDNDMLYKLNGRPLFLSGAWLPLSKLYPADTDRWTYEKDLRLARHANMNHLTTYTVIEQESFYDLADRLGILLFVELPFNQLGPLDALNAKYPRRDEYIAWCSQEVAQIVRAIGNHPSVAVWSPVSEVTTNGQDFTTSWDFRLVEAADGYSLFLKKLEEVVKQNDPDALYFRSLCDFGERHFWEGGIINGTTYHGHFDAKAGFVSEYGVQAFFPFEDIRRVVDPEELWGQGPGQYSSLALPINIKRMSYAYGWQYRGLDSLTAFIAANVDRHVRSFRDFVNDSEVYQAFLYGYAGDAYRRKLFAPINGVRSYCFKSHPEKPVGGYGVVDAFDTPLMAYYVQRRTFAPISMSYAVRYALESVPAGSSWGVPVWISNATNEEIVLTVESALYNLKGERLLESQARTSVAARQAREVTNLDWRLPDQPGVYLLRSRARQGSNEVADAGMYVKVAPRAMRKVLRVLVLGNSTWAEPIADYLRNLGASVTTVIYEPTVIREPKNSFPVSLNELLRKYDVIWLAGFKNYWRDAPEQWTQTIIQAVESGVTFVHTGSWASYHGGGLEAAALDLTPLAQVLPVKVQHENDLFPRTSHRLGDEINAPPPSWPGAVTATGAAPRWLREVDFTGLAPEEGYHVLDPRPDANVLMRVGSQALLVSGQYGKGRTLAYLGFSPAVFVGLSPEGFKSVPDLQPVIVDRAIRSSGEGRLFAIISASLLALASGEDPPSRLSDLVESRATPLYETLKNSPQAPWPNIFLAWTLSPEGRVGARIHIQNGATYLRGLRLRFEGPDFREGKALGLWSSQFFDLLPSEAVECSVELVTATQSPLRDVTLEAETLYGPETKSYPLPVPPK